MRTWIIPIVAGTLLGLASVFLPLPWGHDQADVSVRELQTLGKAELHKKIEGMRLQAVRLSSDGLYRESMDLFLSLIDMNHHDQFSYIQMARIYRDGGEELFDGLLDESGARSFIYDLDRIRGAVYYQVGELPKAKEAMGRFLVQKPGDLAATFYLGAIAKKEGASDVAERYLLEVVKREKSYFYAYLELLDLYEKRGDSAMSDKYFKLAWEYNPANNKEGVCCGLPLTEEQKRG
ncbi:MAG: hypothetical protein HQK87_08495 [Nitrospinae bacterium]|nr:hypothetical protein [Nitrospinota bacterium]